MYTLFTTQNPREARVAVPASFTYVQKQLRKNLLSVLRHCRGASYAVPSDHLLVKLLLGLNVDPNLPLFEYHRKVEARSERVARSLNLTTASQRGKVVDGDGFYGPQVREIVVAINEDVDLLNVESTWTNLTPVTILRHPFTTLALEPLDGRMNTDEPSWAVVQVDLVQLALQYRQWYLRQKQAGEAFLRTPMQFAFEFPLANGLLSHLEWSLINRLHAHQQGQATEAFYSSWPFHLTDLDSKVDKYLLERVSFLTQRPMRYDEMMENIPLVGRETTLFAFSRLPPTAVTRQNAWVLTMAVLPIIELLVQLDFEAGGSRNLQEASVLRKRYREALRDREFDAVLDSEQAAEVLDRIDRAIMAYL